MKTSDPQCEAKDTNGKQCHLLGTSENTIDGYLCKHHYKQFLTKHNLEHLLLR